MILQKLEDIWNTSRGTLIVGTVVVGIILTATGYAFSHSLDIHHWGPHEDSLAERAKEKEAERACERLREHEGNESWYYDSFQRDRDEQISQQWDMDHMN